MPSDSERDVRDVARAYLNARSLDEYYQTMYPKPEPGISPWGAVSNLTDVEVRKIVLAYHLRRKWNLSGPAQMADDFMRIIVSRDGMGREQAVRTHTGDIRKKASIWQRFWPGKREMVDSP